MKKRNAYWNKLAAYLAGELNQKEGENFMSVVKANERMKEDYDLMKNSWKNFKTNPDTKYSDTNLAWEKFNWKIEQEGLDEIQLANGSPSKLKYVLRIAAVAILILAVGVPAFYYTYKNNLNADLEYQSMEGSATVDLPDGSRVFLNEGASLKYKKNFEDARNVDLKGEGYFDVMSNPKKPFKVNTGKVLVTVLGTSFNIRNVPNDAVEVYVESGKVEVSMKKDNESLQLMPGQLAVAKDQLILENMNDVNYLSWKTKDFKFVDAPVSEVLHILETSYHVDIDTHQINIAGRRLTTEYSGQSIDAILETICTALNINYLKEDKVYILQSQ